MKFPMGILRCRRPKMRDYAGRTWDQCRVTLPDGTITEGYLDTSWGHWFYFQHGGQWFKGRIDVHMQGSNNDVDLRAKMTA